VARQPIQCLTDNGEVNTAACEPINPWSLNSSASTCPEIRLSTEMVSKDLSALLGSLWSRLWPEDAPLVQRSDLGAAGHKSR
jgi:hypothetical protein